MRHLIVIALVVAFARVAAAAPPVQLVLRDGMVWLVARDAPLSQVFEEWARVGQTRVINADHLTGRLSIDLNGMPEGEALDVLLRAVGGFVATQRGVADVSPNTAQSRFAQIVIVAGHGQPPRSAAAVTSATPVFSQPPASSVPIAPGVQRLLGADGQPVPDDQEDAPVAVVPRPPAPSMPPGFATPPQARPATPAPAQPGPAGSPFPGMMVPPPTTTPAARRSSGL